MTMGPYHPFMWIGTSGLIVSLTGLAIGLVLQIFTAGDNQASPMLFVTGVPVLVISIITKQAGQSMTVGHGDLSRLGTWTCVLSAVFLIGSVIALFVSDGHMLVWIFSLIAFIGVMLGAAVHSLGEVLERIAPRLESKSSKPPHSN